MTEAPKPYLREAKFPEDFDAILEVSRKAFQLDPVFVFWGNVTEVRSLFCHHERIRRVADSNLCARQITPTGLKEEDDKRLLTFLSFLLLLQ